MSLIQKIEFMMIFSLSIVLISCEDSDNLKGNDDYGWSRYVGKHFTSESDLFYWSLSESNFGNDFKRYLQDGEYVEFCNLTDSSVTLKYGYDNKIYYNLAESTDNIINQNIMCPFPGLLATSTIEIPLVFSYKPNDSYCYLNGKYADQYGIVFRFYGKIKDKLYIIKEFNYRTPFPLLREKVCNSLTSYAIMNLETASYDFDCDNLKCRLSPIIAKWQTENWDENLATSISSDPSELIQLLIGIPILNCSDYYGSSPSTSKQMSVLDLIVKLFPGVRQTWDSEYKEDIPTWNFSNSEISFGLSTSAVVISKTDNNRMCVMIDPPKFVITTKYAKSKLFYANILRSLLSEDRCHFEMQYELIDCDFNDKSKEREFLMTLTDPQLSRNIMEYVILPLIIENRQAIKDYIRQDAELSQHAEILCSAVDHLEEIYAGTTDLTLGYRLIEHQWDCPNLIR